MKNVVKFVSVTAFVVMLTSMVAANGAYVQCAPPAPGCAQFGECLVQLRVSAPQNVSVDQDFQAVMCVRALKDIADVTVRAHVPDGLQFVKSEPAADASGGVAQWVFPSMDCCDVENIKVWFKVLKEGASTVCATVSAVPRICFTVCARQPMLEITKTGPETALLGQNVTYTVTVKNTGTGAANDVKVTDTIPPGLTHSSGQSTLEWSLGTVCPGDVKTATVTLRAAERGTHCNKAMVDSSNANSASAEACTLVQIADLEITKEGTPEQFIGKKADYTIVVKNTGDVDLNGVSIVDSAPGVTTIVDAEGGSVAGTSASWTIDTLKSGESATKKLTLTTMTPGTHENCAQASAMGLSARDCAETLWKGIGAILLEVIDTMDPLQIGEPETYIIRVTNQGSDDDKNIVITADFPPEIDPVSASGATAGKVDGKKVVFEPYAALAPKQAITYEIQAEGKKEGDGRLKVYLDSDVLTKPVLEEESTHVY
jgi:uncharacterized repeat protein (TIGR01451 family)